jgi:hypothetical protein
MNRRELLTRIAGIAGVARSSAIMRHESGASETRCSALLPAIASVSARQHLQSDAARRTAVDSSRSRYGRELRRAHGETHVWLLLMGLARLRLRTLRRAGTKRMWLMPSWRRVTNTVCSRGFTTAFSIRTMKASSTGTLPWSDAYYALIKHHLTELHSRYPNTFYQLLDITWKVSQDQRWELYRLIKKYSPNGIVVMNQAFYQSRRNLGRICEPKSWPTDVINAEDTLPPEEGHDPYVTFGDMTYYMPMESWTPTGPPYKPMPPMHSWFWRPGFVTQSADVIASAYFDCRRRKWNLLLNLSPDRTGRLPDDTVKTMHEVAELLHR